MAVSSQLDRLFAYRPGRLAWGTLRVTAGMLLKALLQAGVLIVLARALGVERYGGFVATLALMNLFTPLAGSGGALLLVRDTARDPALFPEAFGRALLMLAVTGSLCVLISIAIAIVVLPHAISPPVIIVLAISELIFAPVVDLAARAYQGFERTGRMILFMASLFMMRLVLLLIVWTVVPLSALRASWVYAISALAIATFTFWIAVHELGRPRFRWGDVFKGLWEGIHFGINYAAFRIHADIDKVMLARLDNLVTAGFFTAAYRVVQMALLPVLALVEAAYTRLFRAGRAGTTDAVRLMWRWLPVPLIYTLVTCVVLFLCAGLVPKILGNDFQPAVSVVRWLAVLPLLSLFRYGMDATVGAANRQRLGAAVMVFGAASNVGLNFWLIPLLSWKGAVFATYGSEILMLIAFCIVLPLGRRIGSQEPDQLK